MLGHDHGVDTRMLYSANGGINNKVLLKDTKRVFCKEIVV